MHFNSAQQQAIQQDPNQSHCLVLAGAGSGKTAVIVQRLMHLLKLNCKPIWCITFTRKAALEMRERFGSILQESSAEIISIRNQIEQAPNSVQLETFHIFARQILHQLSIPVPQEVNSWIPLATESLNQRCPDTQPPKGGFDLNNHPDEPVDSSLSPGIYSLPFFILIDEFQDINPEQIKFCQALGASHIFAVGDDDQAIYGFRGSSTDAIENFGQYFHPFSKITLNFNYRSRQCILDLANRLFSHKGNSRKRLISSRPLRSPLEDKNEKPKWKSFTSSKSQNAWVVHTILSMKRKYPFLRWKDFAILVRLNQLVSYYCDMLYFENIPDSKKFNEGVRVMTIHSSKGLQFPIVFICDLSANLFPHFETFTIPTNFDDAVSTRHWEVERLNEEERLLYVAITRAESFLYLLHCKRRVWRGQWCQFKPSPFFKLKHTQRCQMVTWLKLKCFMMVNLYMIGFMVLYLPVLFQSSTKKNTWVKLHSEKWAHFVLKHLRLNMTLNGLENQTDAEGRHLFIISNHISWADIPSILVAFQHKLGFVAKAELTRIPVLHYWMRQIGCIFINRKKHREAMRALHHLESKDQFTRIVLFPEGTRSKNGKIGPLKPGGLKIAWSLGALIQPVHIKGTRESWEDRSNLKTHQGSLKIFPALDLASLKEDGMTFLELLSKVQLMLQEENGDI